MFHWWISWLWISMCVNINVNGGIRASNHYQSAILPPSHLGAPQIVPPLNVPGRLLGKGAQGKVELGPGMGGSAVEPPEGREGAQYFATQPTPQTAVIGSTVVLPCRVINKVGHLQWTRNGFGLGTDRDLSGFSRYSMIGSDDEGDFSLRIKPVVLDDDATYQCQVSAMRDIPGIRSHKVQLTVYVPPQHPRVQPAIISATAGMKVTLECHSAGGRPPPEIQWVDNSKRETLHRGVTQTTEIMADGKRVTVHSRLIFTPDRSHHNSSITCQTSNQALSSPLSSSIGLSVLYPPEVKLEILPPSLSEGHDAKFICTADANPPVISYRWYHNNEELVGETSRVLILRRISRNTHRNTIACQVSNAVGTSKKTQSIHVHYGPYFRHVPSDVMADTGKNVLLKCDVDSNPTASIVWLHQQSNKMIGTGSELVVDVDEDNAGLYTCVANVRGFQELRGSMRVLVKGPPIIVSSTQQEGRIGDSVTIQCTTISIPKPIKITWTHHGNDIDPKDPRYKVLEEEHDDNVQNLLTIHDTNKDDFGEYNCTVVNEYGVARKQIRLNQQKTVPVLVIVCGGVGVVLVMVAVVVTSIVLCNKTHSTIKGSVSGEKVPSLTIVPAPGVANMYSAPSETKLCQYMSSSPAPSTATRNMVQDDDGTRCHVPLVNYTSHDNTTISNGTTSISELGADTKTLQSNHTNSTLKTTPDFCTIRRGMQSNHVATDFDLVRGTDIASGMNFDKTDLVRGTDMTSGLNFDKSDLVRGMDIFNGVQVDNKNNPQYSNSAVLRHNGMPTTNSRHSAYGYVRNYGSETMGQKSGLNFDKSDLVRGMDIFNGVQVDNKNNPQYSNSAVLRHNGMPTTNSRHSAYGYVRNYGSPPPPPYPRSSQITSPRGPASPSVLPTSHQQVSASQEVKFIFSPEAMMKPGTLV